MCSLFFERFVLFFCLKIERFVPDSAEIWICGLYFNAELKPGTELLLKAIDFSEKIKGADLIITGEGKADRQTAMGKVPYRILKEAQKEHIPVIVLAGSIENLPELNKAGFKGIFSIAPDPITLEKAMEPEFAKENITRLVSQLYSVITSFG